MIAEIAVADTSAALPVPAIAPELTVLPVSFATILDDSAAPALLRAYAEECLVPDAAPQRPLYAAMERVGAIQCFAAYFGEAADEDGDVAALDAVLAPDFVPDFARAVPLLIGFVSVLRTIVPHDGHHIAAIESLFVDSARRSTGAGFLLLAAAEQYATVSGCRCLLASTRLGSALDLILSHRTGYDRTHSQHTLWLNGYRGGRL